MLHPRTGAESADDLMSDSVPADRMRPNLALLLCATLLLAPSLDALLSPSNASRTRGLFSTAQDGSEDGTNGSTNDSADDDEVVLPPILANLSSWRIGDLWLYDASLDASSVVEDAEELEGASVGVLSGVATMELVGIELFNDSGRMVPVHLIEVTATVSGPGTFPEPNTGILTSGTLLIDFSEIRYQRVSDLAFVRVERVIDLDFQFTFLRLDISDFTDSRTYSPAREMLDFPIRESDVWSAEYTETSVLAGNGGPIEIPAEPEVKARLTTNEVSPAAAPPVQWAGCEEVGELTVREAGEAMEVHWWCEAIAGDVYWWTDEVGVEGISGEFRLTAYEPASVDSSTFSIVVDLEPNTTMRRTVVNVSVSVRDVAGALIEMQNLTLFNGSDSTDLVVDHPSGAAFSIDSGAAMDSTPTEIDWSTDGIVICHEIGIGIYDVCGSATLTLEGSAVGEIIRRRAQLEVIAVLDPLLGSGQDATWLIRL